MIGRVVGRYHVIAKLGEGGMGTVWKAEDTVLRRAVAIKFLPPDLVNSEEARRRFLREARASSGLEHSGIATLYDIGEAEGELYIAVAFVDGETVADLVSRGPLAPAEALRITAEAAEALAHAHSRGVIHRDVTARNIMVATDRRAVVIDFGLAFRAGTSRITSSGATVGTFAYVAPEAAQGHAVDHRSDIYGLGVVLYEMLTATLPFPGARPAALLYSALHTDPDPPSRRKSDLPPALDRIVLRAMARDPQLRYPSAIEFARVLRECECELHGPRPPAGPPTAPACEPAGSRGPAAAPGPPVLLPSEKRLAVVAFRETTSAQGVELPGQAFATGLAETLSAALARIPDLQVIPPSSISSAHGSEDVRGPARRMGANLVLTGLVRRVGEQLRVSYSILDPRGGALFAGDTLDGRMADLFLLEDQLLDSVIRSLDLRAAPHSPSRLVNPAAHEQFLQALGYMQRADHEASVNGAIHILEALSESEGETGVVQAQLAKAYLHKFILTRQPQWVQRAESTCRKALQLEPHSPEVLVTLGRVQIHTGHYANAEKTLCQSLEVRRNNAEALQYLSTAYERLGAYAEAEEACRHAIAVRPEYWGSHNRLGSLLYHQGKYREAIESYRRVVELVPDNTQGLNNLAATYFELGELEPAAGWYERSIGVRPTASPCIGLGTVLFFLGRREEAAGMFRRAVDLRPEDPETWGNLADAQRWSPGLRPESDRSLDRAIALARAHLQVNPDDAESWSGMAKWLAKRGHTHESLHAIQRALQLTPQSASCVVRAVTVYHLAGDRAKALDCLARAVQGSFNRIEVERDPELQSLREEVEARRILSQSTDRGQQP